MTSHPACGSSSSSVNVIEAKEASSDDSKDDARRRLGTEAIEQLASGLNLAANTIEEYSQNVSKEYFHENDADQQEIPPSSFSQTIDEENLKQLNDEQLLRLLEEAYHSKKLDEKNKSAIFKEILEDVHESLATPDKTKSTPSQKQPTASSNRRPLASASSSSVSRNAAQFDSIAALTEIMDSSSSITIPASTHNKDPDADTSSTKTEVEEMELDQFSDLEENIRTHENAKRLDENGNPSSGNNSSVSFTARQLKPLSIYRHNPAFHSQHVSVNQMDEIPPLSPTALQPATSLSSANNKDEESNRGGMISAKTRRKKKAVKTEESIKAEDIDGYRGGEDLESLLQFIESTPKGRGGNNGNPELSGGAQVHQPSNAKSKRSRRIDRKSKRSRTPSVTTPSKEKSPDACTQSQKTSRASSTSVTRPMVETPETSVTVPDSVTTVKNSLIVVNNNNAKKTLKKPKKQAGWLVDFNNDIGSKNRMKAKPPSGKAISDKKEELVKESEEEVLNHNDDEANVATIITSTNEDSSDEPTSIQDEIVLSPDEDEKIIIDNLPTPTTTTTDHKSQKDSDFCFNYASILKFIKQEWDIVTMEISNGSNDIQSKVVYYKPR